MTANPMKKKLYMRSKLWMGVLLKGNGEEPFCRVEVAKFGCLAFGVLFPFQVFLAGSSFPEKCDQKSKSGVDIPNKLVGNKSHFTRLWSIPYQSRLSTKMKCQQVNDSRSVSSTRFKVPIGYIELSFAKLIFLIIH